MKKNTTYKNEKTQEPSNIKQRRDIGKPLFIYIKLVQASLEVC